MPDDFRNSPAVRTDDGHSATHGFYHGEAERFSDAGHHDQVQAGHERPGLGAKALEEDYRLKLVITNDLLQVLMIRSVGYISE